MRRNCRPRSVRGFAARALGCAFAALVAVLSASAQQADTPPQPNGFPYTMRPGDVLVNAPVGVLRRSASSSPRTLYSPALGVTRTPAPVATPSTSFFSPPLGVHRGAAIRALVPQQLAVGTAAQALRVEGAGLAGASAVQVVPPAGTTVDSFVAAAAGDRIDAVISVAPTAAPGLRRVRVLDAAGKAIAELSPGAADLLIAADLPRIDSLIPSVHARGSTGVLEIRGTHLRGLPFRAGEVAEQPQVRVTPSDGVSLGNAPQSNDAGTLVTVPITIAASAPLTDRVVQVITASGTSTAQAVPNNTLRIVDGPLRTYTPFVSPVVGIMRGSAPPLVRQLVSAPLGVTRGPAIRTLSPTFVSPGDQVRVRLGGVGLAAFGAVEFTPSTGITVVPGSYSASAAEVAFDIEVASNAPLFARRVTLVDGAQRLVAPALLEIRDAMPVLTALTPTWLQRDGTSQTIVIQGLHLSQTTGARILSDTDLVVESYVAHNDTSATLSLRAAPTAAIGPRVVRVLGLNEPSTATPTPGNTLNVVDRRQVLTPFVAPPVGVVRGQVSTTIRRDAYAPAVGIVRGAHARSVTPARIARGQPTRMTVTGVGLATVDAVALAAPDGLAVRNVLAAPDGTSVAFDVDVPSDAVPGPRRVDLVAATRPIPFVAPDAALFVIDANITIGPVANADSYEATINTPLAVGIADGVLANDVANNGGDLYAVLRRLPSSGTLNLQANGSFVYTPNADFSGTDRFEYSAGAGATVGAAAIVTITVREPNDARDDTYTTPDNVPLVAAANVGLLANDVIAAGAAVTIELTSQPTLGTLQLGTDGAFTYTPNGTAGVDRFRYRLVAGGVRSAPAEVAITVVAVNEAPLAADDAYAVDRGRTLNVAAPGVLANDRDPDRDPLTVTLVDAPLVGTLNLQTNGGFSYTPPPDYVGEASFRYLVRDPQGLSAQATVRIIVNQNLAPLPDAYSFNEGEVLFVDAPGLLANDSIIAQGPLRVVVTQPPAFGTLTTANDGSFVYRPDTNDRNGIATFRYRLEDNAVTSPAVEVRLTIVAVNDPPSTDDDRYLTDENAELVVAAPGVLGNDTDGDSATFTAQVLTPPAHGTLTLRPDGSFDYVPQVNYRGVDTFTYNAVDAGGATASGTVTIDVTAPPTVTNDVFIVDIDTPFTTPDNAVLLINDFDSPENDPLVVIVGEGPSHGRIENLDLLTGKFTYIPDAGYTGIDTMTYRATDGRSESNVGVVTFAVGITNFPRAFPDEYETTEDQELIVPAIDGVLANDTDADTPHDQLQVFLVGYDSYNFSHLDVTLAPDGSFRVRPWANFYGETFFIYQVYDGTDVSNAAVVKIKVLPVNDGVEANDDRYGVLRNTVFEPGQPIRANDRYDEDYPVNFEVVVQPQSGTVELDAQTGHFRYTPTRDFAGTDTFTYRLFQVDTGIGDTAVVTLRTNGPAIAAPDAYSGTEDSVAQVTPHPLANDSDPDGDPIRLSWPSISDLRYIALTVADVANPQSTTTLTTTNHFYGTQELTYAITDGTATTYSKATFTIAPVPDAPVAEADSYLTQRNTTLQIGDANQGVLRNDFDPDTRPYAGGPVWAAAQGPDLLPITAQLVSTTSHGTLTLSQVGTFTYVPQTDWSGIDTFTYRVNDATGRQSAVVTASIRVNSPAVANDDAYVLNEDVPLTVPAAQGLLINDTDVDGDALYAGGASSGCAPCNGRVAIRQDGSFTYTPNANFHGQDEFFYSVRDGVADFDVGRVGVTVLPVNDAPVTEPDTYRTREDEVLVAAEPQGALRNDREVDGERLVDAESTVPPAHGNIVFGPDGAFTYTPDVDFNGRDTFKYRVFDQTGLFTEEDVEVIVTSVNDAPRALADEYATEQTAVLTVDAAHGVLANDSDVDGPSPTAALTGLPQHGEVTLEADGSFVYRPDGFFAGVDQFQYQIDDGLGALATAAVSIRVNAVAPEVRVTVDDDFYRFEGPTLDEPAPGLLANDTVTGAPALTAALVLAPERGTVEVHADGSFRYTAPPGWSGVVGFTYSASAAGVTELGHATLTVLATANEPPVALGEQFGVLEDHVLDSASSGNLLANDRDHEGAPLTLEVTTLPAHGVLDARSDGAFTYTPAPNYNGADAFVYRVSDGVRQSNPATASISVIAQNDAPVAQPDRYQGPRATPIVADAAHGLLANDSDADGDALTVELVDAPIHGQVQAAADGSFVYTPQPDFSGDDSFRYAAGDGNARGIAQVVLTIADAVNRAPVAQGETYTIDEDATLASATAGSLVANDVDPDGDALSVVVATPPAHGTLTLVGNEFEYRPARDWSGDDAFVYRVSDGALSSAPVTAAIVVRPVNDPPSVATDLYSVQQGATLSVPAATGVLANDADVEGAALTAAVHAQPSHGMLTLAGDGSFTYRPNASFLGRDEFVYRASDGAATADGRVAIDVTATANQRPLAVGEVFAIAEDSVLDTRVLESLLANDRDPEGQPLTLVIVAPPAHGTLELFAGGHVVYTPARDATGDVVIRYAVSDGELQSEPVSLLVTLLPQNDAPRPQADLYTIPAAATQFSVDAAHGVLANDVEPDGDALVVEVVEAPSHGTLNLALDGAFVYVPGTPRPARDRFIYRVRDPAGLDAQAVVELVLGDVPGDAIFKDGFESTP